VWLNIEMVFGWLFAVELVAKVLAFGAVNYWRKGPNRFDCLVTIGVVITQVGAASTLLQEALSTGRPLLPLPDLTACRNGRQRASQLFRARQRSGAGLLGCREQRHKM
jgi:hypothetical protein